MPPRELLAKGRTAEIYAWEEGQILKLFLPRWGMDEAEYEFTKARAAQDSGFAVPQVHGVTEHEGRAAIIYKRIDGQTMLQALQERLWTFPRLARQLAELHSDMHQRSTQGLPTQPQRLRHKVEEAAGLSEDTKAKVLAYLETLPTGDKLLHGDFHLDNVMLTASGPVIIDWVDASSGHPLADVARSVVLLKMSVIPKDTPGRSFILLLRELFSRVYLNTYFRHSPFGREELDAWMLPVVAGRLSEGIEEEQASLVAFVEQRVSQQLG